MDSTTEELTPEESTALANDLEIWEEVRQIGQVLINEPGQKNTERLSPAKNLRRWSKLSICENSR